MEDLDGHLPFWRAGLRCGPGRREISTWHLNGGLGSRICWFAPNFRSSIVCTELYKYSPSRPKWMRLRRWTCFILAGFSILDSTIKGENTKFVFLKLSLIILKIIFSFCVPLSAGNSGEGATCYDGQGRKGRDWNGRHRDRCSAECYVSCGTRGQ